MAETTLPEPLVPAEVDLRDFPFTPMFRARLFGSAFHAEASDAEWRAGLTLWLKSWDQVPAGTLPKGDVELCRLAELGRDHRTWKRLRAVALRGWIECADGRLHHRVVAEGVLEAWKQKMDQRVRTTKARIAKIEIRLRKERDPIEKSRLQAMVDALRADLKRYATCSVAESVTDDVSDAATDRATDDAIDDVTDAEADRAAESVASTKGREGKRREEIRSNLASGDKSPSAAAKAREDALCQPAGISDGDLADSVETVFSAVARSAENWFAAVERDRHDGDEVVIRGWLELAGSAGLSDADAVQAIAEAIDRQFERLSKRPRVGMPVSLELIDKDVRAAISAARRNPSKVADEARAPEPYAARFTATQWTTWLKPCAVTVADRIATITAPTMVIADRLRVHHDQDLRVCLDVDAVEVVAAPRRKGASATIIPHPATVAEVSK